MPSRGRGGENDPKKSAEEIMKRFDRNNDGKLSKDEFLEGYAQVSKFSSLSMFY
jgi:Ca2+-binding EF-hand superfamily protein